MFRRLVLVLVFVALRFVLSADACGPSLTTDPEFDFWCGDALCAWAVEEGAVTRVPTWHRSDFGVSLEGPRVRLSQRLTAAEDCLTIELQGERDEGVAFWIDVDWFADGTIDDSQALDVDGWAVRGVRSAPPLACEDLRLVLRKEGAGRAVLARLRVDPGTGCGERVEVVDRPLGYPCASTAHCASGRCGPLEEARPGWPEPPWRCAACDARAGCAADEVCGAGWGPYGLHGDCVAAGSRSLGERCVTAAECATGRCADGWCSTCDPSAWGSDGCPGDEPCALTPRTAYGGPRLCSPDGGRRAAEEPCLADADCASGACRGEGVLQVCWDGRPCDDDGDCTEGTCGTLGVVRGRCE